MSQYVEYMKQREMEEYSHTNICSRRVTQKLDDLKLENFIASKVEESAQIKSAISEENCKKLDDLEHMTFFQDGLCDISKVRAYLIEKTPNDTSIKSFNNGNSSYAFIGEYNGTDKVYIIFCGKNSSTY